MTQRERQLEKRNADLEVKLAERDATIKLLEHKLDLLIKRVFGSSSEKLNPAQLELLLGEDQPGKYETSCASDVAQEEEKPKD